MAKVSLAEILQLSVTERLQLVQDIWDSIAAQPENVPVTQAQRNELDRRLKALEQEPEAGSSWEEVRARIRRSK
jgi:putative addiction module component (TIGR02574 family)